MILLIVIHYLFYLIFKPKNNILSCGIFGWAGKDPKKFNKDKFDKLGFFNMERGKNSCGVAYDGDVYIGIDSRKLYSDFIVDETIKPIKYPFVIGHTRQASFGAAVTADNAHPFAFEKEEYDEYVFFGCHNGTLYNADKLAEKYGIEKSEKKVTLTKFNVWETTTRKKIDSEILLEILYKVEGFEVLSEYNGGAALMFTNIEEPNVVYLWKGASKLWNYALHKEEERPLYVYQETKNSLYISSLEDSLRTIGGNDSNIIDIEENTVFRITNGDFKNCETFKVDRSNSQQKELFNTTTRKNNAYYNQTYMFDADENYSEGRNSNFYEKKPIREIAVIPKKEEDKEKNKVEDNIYSEETVQHITKYGKKLYFNKLRFWRNGHLVNGIYCYIPKYGFYFLSCSKKDAIDKWYFYIGKPFVNGNFEEEIVSINDYVPFTFDNSTEPTLFYFVEGVRLRTYLDYSIMKRKYDLLDKNCYLPFIELSEVSTHPVINIKIKRNKEAQVITWNSKVYSGNFVELGSDKQYQIISGNLINTKKTMYYSDTISDKSKETIKTIFTDIKEKQELDKNKIIDLKVDVTHIQKNLELDLIKEEKILDDLIEKENNETEFIVETLNEDFSEPIQDFQNIKKKMEEYKENTVAKNAISFIDDSIIKINNLLEFKI